MCVAILQKEKAAKIPKVDFETYSRGNHDGYGIMYVDKGKLEIVKTMSLNEHWDNYERIHRDFGQTSCIGIHFRAGTQGVTDTTNCHPFRVSDTMGMMHNGVFAGLKDDLKSDTHLFNEQYCIPLGNDIFDNISARTLLEKEVAHNKVIFLSSEYEPSFVILREDLGEWRNNSWYSFKTSTYTNQNWWGVRKRECCICKTMHVEMDMYNIDPPIGMSVFVCQDCVNVDTKLSSIVPIIKNNETLYD